MRKEQSKGVEGKKRTHEYAKLDSKIEIASSVAAGVGFTYVQ